jgi:hypothetical protein
MSNEHVIGRTAEGHDVLGRTPRASPDNVMPVTGIPVLQDWVIKLPFMQQTVLLGIVRGPDDTPKYHPIKPILRWYRRCLLLSALDGEVITNPYDPRGGSFTGPSLDATQHLGMSWQDAMRPRVNDMFQHMDSYPIHFWLHMMHAVEIMGYKHSDGNIATWWCQLYVRMVHAMHVFPETVDQLDMRLGDDRDGWLARSDEAITK